MICGVSAGGAFEVSIRSTLTISGVSFAMLLAAGCWNGGNDRISLGDVSIGQQMIDLKAALQAGAISEQEYDRLKRALMALGEGCDDSGD